MGAPTKILLWSEEEAEERVSVALNIMDRLQVDDLNWDTVFNGVMNLLAGAALQQEQSIPIDLGRIERGRPLR